MLIKIQEVAARHRLRLLTEGRFSIDVGALDTCQQRSKA
jgi:hypothetical protein